MDKPRFIKFNLYPLSDGWIPPKLLVREKQLKTLLANYWSDVKVNYWIYGSKGLGKTLTAKIYSRVDENAFIINMTGESFKRSIIRFAYEQGVKPKLTSDPDWTLQQVIESKVDGKQVTIFFDDVDALGRTFKGEFSLHLKNLYDWLLRDGYSFSINCISTRDIEQAKRGLLDVTWSRLRFYPLFFPPYSKDEVVELLKQRLNYIEGLEWSDLALELIGEYVSDMDGDFRLALEIARKTILDHGKISLESVSNELEFFRSEFTLNQIRGMGFHQALILGCIVEETVRRHEDIPDKRDWEHGYLPVSWDRVKSLYEIKCRRLGGTPQNQKMLYYWLEKLWFQGWIEKFTLAKRHEWNYIGKRSLFVRLLADLETLIKAFKRLDWKNY